MKHQSSVIWPASPLPPTLNNNLIAYWKLDETSGTRKDSVGSNDLTDNNTVTSASGKVGNAASFTAASSQYLTAPNNAILRMGDIDFSIAAWVNLTTKGATRNIVAKRTAPPNLEYYLRYDTGGDRYNFEVSPDGSNPTSIAANTFGSPATSAWHFVVAWHDSVNNFLGISINNGAADTVSYSTGVFAGTTAILTLGAQNAAEFWNGLIDEVGIWKNRVLSSADRTSLYNGGAGRTWPLP